MRHRKEKWKNKLLGILYPRRCPVCHKIVAERGRLICVSCFTKVHPIREPKCKKCGKELTQSSAEYCYDCQNKSHHYDQGLGIFPYSQMKESIMWFKYHGRREYAQFYAAAMMTFARDAIEKWNPQVLIPVPIHKNRMKKRGYNQAEEIAKQLGKMLSLPVESHTVKRIHRTAPQKELGGRERKQNLKQAFLVKEERLFWERVLIIDDIYTTGSTVDGVSKCLKEKGVKYVFFLSVCVGGGF